MISLLLISLYPSHDHFILLTVSGPSPVSISIRVASVLYFPPRHPPFPSVCFAEATLLHFPLTRWGNSQRACTDCLARSHLESHLLRILCTSFTRNHRVLGAFSAPVVYDYRLVENNARDLANVREPWRFASRIMLSTTYALRSATSAKLCREFYCGPSRYTR